MEFIIMVANDTVVVINMCTLQILTHTHTHARTRTSQTTDIGTDSWRAKQTISIYRNIVRGAGKHVLCIEQDNSTNDENKKKQNRSRNGHSLYPVKWLKLLVLALISDSDGDGLNGKLKMRKQNDD